MLTVSHLKKSFNQTEVIHDISFDIKTGEVVGFLGPNGAGKTTTMRLIAGFLAPTEGKILVADTNVADQPLITRQHIGYLPENNPMYETMRVYEYLNFVAKTKVAGDVSAEVKRVAKACHVGEKITSVIGELSKGYKQRVGLAAALLGNPDVLLLDEPTSGLDPNQAAEIRNLIRQLGKTKTVLFSSHILTEVQQACDRVIIIHRGSIVAQGTVSELTAKQVSSATTLTVEVTGDSETVTKLSNQIRQLPHVTDVQREQANLETVFRQLTQ